jgi:hypothetical protein
MEDKKKKNIYYSVLELKFCEGDCLLGCNALDFGRDSLTFLTLLPPLLG